MLFVDFRFFVFFAVVLTAYWSLSTNNARKWLILFASYYFYGSWDWRFAIMLAVLSAADWYFGLHIERSQSARTRKMFVYSSVGMNLSALAFFKYFHFFVDSAIAVAARMRFHLDQPTLNIILPIGVSFFTFQSLSYTIDVYRREIPAVRSLRDYLMFASFFPQLVAGPIVRPKYFMPQMAAKRTVSLEDVKRCQYLFLLGFLKKTAIADNISPYVDRVFNAPVHYNAVASISATWLYATQIFCDFSGYSDMAIAVAGLLGYKLALNFDAPYLAVSIQGFWRRWHISLSTWIRDYIYISLGGSRMKTRWGEYRKSCGRKRHCPPVPDSIEDGSQVILALRAVFAAKQQIRRHKRPLLIRHIARITTTSLVRHPSMLDRSQPPAKNLTRYKVANAL
jgi:alginate O-acetyltransferase complex protein AlgI